MDEVLIHFRLVGDEARALCELSARELRKPRDQVRLALREELHRRGLLPARTISSDSQPEPVDAVR